MYGRFTVSSSTTVLELLAWSYANLAMAHAAVSEGVSSYGRHHYAIRMRLHKGLLLGTMKMGSMADDERLKMTLPQSCCYCGTMANLSIDHLIPRSKGGSDHGENLVWACRSCNSSKSAADVLMWFERRGEFPPLLLLRRYLKVAYQHCLDHDLLGATMEEIAKLPFALTAIPTRYPNPTALRLWVGIDPERGGKVNGIINNNDGTNP